MASSKEAWEDAQTEPLLPGRRSSLDDDPPADRGNDASMEAASGGAGDNLARLLALLTTNNTHGAAVGEADAAAIFSYLVRLQDISGEEGGLRWSADRARLVRAAVKSAVRSLDSATNNGNDTAATNNNGGNGGNGGEGVAIMEAATARRLLSDGVLPLASAGRASGGASENINDGTSTGTSPSVWVAKLVRAIVVEDLLPLALAPADGLPAARDDDGSGADLAAGGSGANPALDILLDSFLDRMDRDEASHILPPDSHNAYAVDDILDRLCGMDSSATLRPSAAAAVLHLLRGMEARSGGRLCRRRVWIAKRSGGGNDRQRRGECAYDPVDRPASLLSAGVQALQSLADAVRNGKGDPDAVPPLVHQLALTPLGFPSAIAAAAGNGRGEKRETAQRRGMRLRRTCLEGIAAVLESEDPPRCSGIALNGAADSPNQKQQADATAWRWARHTCLSHLGRAINTDPALGKAVLSLLAGERAPDGAAPWRYARLTPFRLAMGLSMAAAVPRMRGAALDAVVELAVEEETIRARRGRGAEGQVVGMGKPWMDCLVRCVEKESKQEGERHHVLRCLLAVARFSEGGGEGGGGSAASLLQSLVSLGFLLIDCVKKDDELASQFSIIGGEAVRPVAMLAPTLDVATASGPATGAGASPHRAAASVGRCLLSYLFYRSAAAASPFLSSSISLAAGNHRGADGGTALCRSILRTATDKFCCMAPNAAEHAWLLTDLLGFDPRSVAGLLAEEGGSENDMEGLDDAQKRQVVPLALASHHLPHLIDTLSHVPSGGMSPRVASLAVAPAVGRALLLQATQQRLGLGTLWKRSDLADHVDHAFLLSKKALFSADAEKRKYAANALVTLLGVAAVASATGSRAGGSGAWSSLLYDMRGCLRRCLTQHQPGVRLEAYSSLVGLLPTSAGGAAANTQDSVSPASTVSGGSAATPPPLGPLRAAASPALAIPSAAQNALVCIVSELLQSSLERYVAIKEDPTDREARRKRSMGGVGLSQMEMVVEEESPPELRKGGGDEGGSNPFRFEKMISARPSHPPADGKGGGKKKSKGPIGQTLLAEALNRIEEPLPSLLASCIAVTPLLVNIGDGAEGDEVQSGNEMKKALRRIRRQMACCTDVDEYTKWVKHNQTIVHVEDNAQRAQEMAKAKLATLVLVAMIVDVLLCTCISNDDSVVVFEATGGSSDEATNDIEDLFGLREDCIDEAARIMSSFVSSKSKSSKKKGGGKKGMKERNANLEENDDEDEEPKKKKGKSAATSGGSTITKVKSSEINDATLAKNRVLVEQALHNMSPATSHDFLADSLRRFGAEASNKVDAADSDDSDNEEEDGDAATRLARSLVFRRFIITKCLLLMSGSSPLVKAGARFGPLVGPGVELDEKSASTARIAASMTLGPLLFAEFASHCYHLGRTSLAPKPSSSPSSSHANGELSLAQLSMRAFVSCVKGMACDSPGHIMSTATRVNALLGSSIAKASNIVPASKDGFKYYRDQCNAGDACVGIPEDETKLGKTLFPFLALADTTTSEGSDDTTTRLCLFSELLDNSMHGEAAELSHLISTAAEAFVEPNMKEQLGVILLRAWELGDGDRVGVLGLDHGEEGGGSTDNTASCISLAVKVALKLNAGLDGNTHVPLPEGGSPSPGGNSSSLRAERSKMGLPTTLVANWPDKHQKRIQKELHSSSGSVGLGPQIAWAISASVGIGDNFQATFDSDSPSKGALKLKVMKAAYTHASEMSSIANSVASSVDDALNNAEFVTHKLVPHMNASADLAQRFVSCLLFSVSKMISASAPSAEFIDVNGSFASTLLRSTKRFYSVLTKLILSFVESPESLMSNETKRLLDHLTATLMPRVSALLMTLQGKQETASGKFLAESKIESHGKTSALLVFEKEKLDNALLKVAGKLKQAGLEDESEWLEEHVVNNQNRDFVIKGVADAKAREAPKKKEKKEAGAKKRKVKSEPGADKKKKAKKKKQRTESDEDDDDTQGDSVIESVDADESMDEDGSVVDLDKLTAEMEQEDEEDESEEDESEEESSESDGEAEFD